GTRLPPEQLTLDPWSRVIANVLQPDRSVLCDGLEIVAIPRVLGASRCDAANAVQLTSRQRQREGLVEQFLHAGIAAANAHESERCERRDVLLNACDGGAGPEVGSHTRRFRPVAAIELAGGVVRPDVRAMTEDAPFLAVSDTLAKQFVGAREVVDEHRIEEGIAIGSRGLLFELVCERHREALIERLVAARVAGPEQPRANGPQRMRLGGEVALRAGQRQRAAPELEGLLVPAAVRCEHGTRTIR